MAESNKYLRQLDAVLNEDYSSTGYGCTPSQKLSMHMLSLMGKNHVSKMEFNLIVYLSSCQDDSGIAYCNMRTLQEQTGCRLGTVKILMQKLMDKGLIEVVQPEASKRRKEGTIMIRLADNDKAAFDRSGYVRLAHSVLHTHEFRKMCVTAKMIVLYSLRLFMDMKTKDLKEFENTLAEASYSILRSYICDWNHVSRRTFQRALHDIKDVCDYNINYQTDTFYISFHNGMLRSQKRDIDSYVENLLDVVVGDEAPEMIKYGGQAKGLAKLVVTSGHKVKKILSEATGMFKTLPEGSMRFKLDPEQMANAAPMENVLHSLTSVATRFSFNGMDPDQKKQAFVSSWGKKDLKSVLMFDKNIPVWLRYSFSKVIFAVNWALASIRIRRWNLCNFRLTDIVKELYRITIENQPCSSKMVTKILLSNAISRKKENLVYGMA